MEKLHTCLKHNLIMVAATLVIAVIAISSLYFSLLDLLNSGAIEDTDIITFQAAFARTVTVASIATLLVVAFASVMYFRVSKSWAQQAEIFRILAKTAHEAIFLFDDQGNIQFLNRSAESLFGYDSRELLGKSIKRLMPPSYGEMHDCYIEEHLNESNNNIIGQGQQLLGKRKNGSQFPMYLSIGKIQINNAPLFYGLIMDLTTQQQLQREILAIPAREQQRIGEELHDGLGQQLTGLSMLAQSLLNKSSAAEHDLASQLATGLHEALTQVRALSRGLIPVQIYADGFMISLKEITESIQRQSNIPIKLHIDDDVLLFDDATATHLYRIVQESLNNAVKHANASQIDVSLYLAGDHGMLTITDDGVGIPSDLSNSTGLGLNIMRHRCGLFDGEISFNPNGHQGTKVSCRFPTDSEIKH